MTNAETIARLEWRIASHRTRAEVNHQTLTRLAEDYPLKTPEAIQEWTEATRSKCYCQGEIIKDTERLARIRAKVAK